MIPVMQYKGKKVAFMADLLPSVGHLPLPYVMGYDTRPLITLAEKEVFLQKALDEQTIGYSFSMDNGTILAGFPTDGSQYNLYGRQISSYGFPYHPKFQPTSSQQLSASDFISEPFLLEKIVLELTGTVTIELMAESSPAIWSFFLLNSRKVIPGAISKEQNINYNINNSSPTYINFTTSSIVNGNILDVIDTIQVAINAPYDSNGYLKREQSFDWFRISGPTVYTHPLEVFAKSTVKSPLSYNTSIASNFSGSASKILECNLEFSGRNQYYDANGRDWNNSFENPIVVATGSENIGIGGHKIYINQKYTKENPYILLPTDKLTFGFQLPYVRNNSSTLNSLIFSPVGINKIILYGSSLRINPETNQLEEYHETLNQLLSSESIHEVITG
jgi:hypothetical protein